MARQGLAGGSVCALSPAAKWSILRARFGVQGRVPAGRAQVMARQTVVPARGGDNELLMAPADFEVPFQRAATFVTARGTAGVKGEITQRDHARAAARRA